MLMSSVYQPNGILDGRGHAPNMGDQVWLMTSKQTLPLLT